MSLLLALLLSPALAADLPQDPVEKRMVVDGTEQASLAEVQASQDTLARLQVLRELYSRDGDLDRYARDREPIVSQLRDHQTRLDHYREDLKHAQTGQQIVSVLQWAAHARKGTLSAQAAGPRAVEVGRAIGLTERLGEAYFAVTYRVGEEIAFFEAEQASARQRKRLTLFGAGGLLALAAGGAFLMLRLRRKP